MNTDKWFASWDDVVWTEIRTSSGRALRAAERLRYEQIAEMVDGPQNMHNVPSKLLPLEKATRFFNDWAEYIQGWPNWLRP